MVNTSCILSCIAYSIQYITHYTLKHEHKPRCSPTFLVEITSAYHSVPNSKQNYTVTDCSFLGTAWNSTFDDLTAILVFNLIHFSRKSWKQLGPMLNLCTSESLSFDCLPVITCTQSNRSTNMTCKQKQDLFTPSFYLGWRYSHTHTHIFIYKHLRL